eukprot:1160176-Amphidinium_carterae.1
MNVVISSVNLMYPACARCRHLCGGASARTSQERCPICRSGVAFHFRCCNMSVTSSVVQPGRAPEST